MKTLLHITLIAILTPIAAILTGVANPIITGNGNHYQVKRMPVWDIKQKSTMLIHCAFPGKKLTLNHKTMSNKYRK